MAITFEEFYVAEENFYNIGQKVQVIMANVANYIDVSKLGGFDAGYVTAINGETYKIRFDNGFETKIKRKDVYAFAT